MAAGRPAAGDWIDTSTGRLLKVTLASLVEGSAAEVGPDNTTTLVYGVPLTRGAGGPYDLGTSALATWAQNDAPTDGTAVFGPQAPPAVTTATATSPGPDGYRSATVHYLNASGLAVNTASPAGPQAPAEGFIDTAEYDARGHVIRTLDATNRLLALGKLAESAQLAGWGLTGTSNQLAQVLDTRTFYTADGLSVWATRGPAQQLAIDNSPDTLMTGHSATRYSYDEGRPAGLPATLLPTTMREGTIPLGSSATSSTTAFSDEVRTTWQYSPVDGASATGPSSGWVHTKPTKVTVDAAGATPLASSVVYDERGRELRSMKPGSSGVDAGTVQTVYYTADASAADAACRNKPAWAGQPCVTRYAGAVTGHDAARMPGELTVKSVTGYNRFASPTTTVETAGGVSRTTTTTYDAADRVVEVALTGGAAAGSAVLRTRTVYSTSTGDIVRNESLDASGAVVGRVTKDYDALGRLVKYTDASGAWTATAYDRYGQPSVVTDSIGTTRTYQYDQSVDPRGYVTKLTDSVAGEIVPTWGPDGQLDKQALPGGVELTIGYDAARVAVARTYTAPSTQNPAARVVLAQDSVQENGQGQWVRHSSQSGTRTYAYDRVGRLTGVDDRATGPNPVCTSRRYAYDPHSNRTSASTASGAAGAACPGSAGAATVESVYDSADRLVSTTGPGGSAWTYDALGRVTTMPTVAGDAVATTSYFVNDLVAAQEVAGKQRTTWTLDPLGRFATQNASAWVNGAWASSSEQRLTYDGDGDEPAWVVPDATQPASVERWVEGMDGQIALQTSATGDRVVQLVDLHGDVVGTVPIADGATRVSVPDLRLTAYDEFGVPLVMASGATSNAPPVRYGWLGAAQRSADTPAGVLLMGVRLYHPKGLIKTVAVVGEVASMIPGPVGAAAAGVSAVAYAASGNKGKALEMGVTAAAQLVGAGVGVRAAFKVASVAGKIGQRAERVATAVKSAARTVGRSCSFVAGTLVRMADGSLTPIEDLQVGDEVLAGNPVTGETTSEVVITPLSSTGDKHLMAVLFEGDSVAVVATDNHPYWVVGQGWTAAGDLRVGDRTIDSRGVERHLAESIDLGWFAEQGVHNLHVSGTHTFFVANTAGDPDSLVHNAASCNIAKFDVTRKSGIYVLRYSDGRLPYVGRAVNVHRRIHRHASALSARSGFTSVEVHRVKVEWLPRAELAYYMRFGGRAGTSNRIRPSIPRPV